jgi:hypothetical protein
VDTAKIQQMLMSTEEIFVPTNVANDKSMSKSSAGNASFSLPVDSKFLLNPTNHDDSRVWDSASVNDAALLGLSSKASFKA